MRLAGIVTASLGPFNIRSVLRLSLSTLGTPSFLDVCLDFVIVLDEQRQERVVFQKQLTMTLEMVHHG